MQNQIELNTSFFPVLPNLEIVARFCKPWVFLKTSRTEFKVRVTDPKNQADLRKVAEHYGLFATPYGSDITVRVDAKAAAIYGVLSNIWLNMPSNASPLARMEAALPYYKEYLSSLNDTPNTEGGA